MATGSPNETGRARPKLLHRCLQRQGRLIALRFDQLLARHQNAIAEQLAEACAGFSLRYGGSVCDRISRRQRLYRWQGMEV